MKIKKGDKVAILSGKNRGKTGEVSRVFPKNGKVLLPGLNLVKRHLKARGNRPGGIIEMPKPIWAAKVMLVCPRCSLKTRAGYRLDAAGAKSRICKKCQAEI